MPNKTKVIDPITELVNLKKEVKNLRMANEFLKQVRLDNKSKIKIIIENKDKYSILSMCKLLEIPRSLVYYHITENTSFLK